MNAPDSHSKLAAAGPAKSKSSAFKLPAPMDLAEALASEPPELDFVLPGLPAGQVGALVAPGSAGKTMLCLQTAVAVALGNTAAGGLFEMTKPARAVLVAAEEDALLLRIRLHAVVRWLLDGRSQLPFHGPLDRQSMVELLARNLSVFPLAGQRPLLVKDGRQTDVVNQLVEACTEARLVVLDPLRRLHDGEENEAHSMTSVVQAIEDIAQRTRAAVVVTHHVSKVMTLTGQGDAAGAARGSTALTDGVRWQANLSAPTRDDADALGIQDHRSRYVKFDITKANYFAIPPTTWLARRHGGVLERTDPPGTDDTESSYDTLRKSASTRKKKPQETRYV